jgi:hypothetical protein
MKIFPRPVAPRSAMKDLWALLVDKRAHKWPLLGVSAALTWLIVWAFIVDANTNTTPKQNQIIYFRSWDKERPESEIILEQKRDLARYEAALRQKQNEMQKVADMFGVEWREEKARNDARRAEALKQINTLLDARLAAAQAKEGAQQQGAR